MTASSDALHALRDELARVTAQRDRFASCAARLLAWNLGELAKQHAEPGDYWSNERAREVKAIEQELSEAFEAMGAQREAQPAALPPHPSLVERWVSRTRAWALCRTEGDADDHRFLSGLTGQAQPLRAQLKTLLSQALRQRNTFEQACATVELQLHDYDSNLWPVETRVLEGRYANGTVRPASGTDCTIPMRVTVCASSPQEKSVIVDALEWFANAKPLEIETLVHHGLNDSPAAAHVATDLAEKALDIEVRRALDSLLRHMRSMRAAMPEKRLAGLCVVIDEDGVARLLANDADLADSLRGEGSAVEAAGLLPAKHETDRSRT